MGFVSKFSKGFKIFGITTWMIINGLILISFFTKMGPINNVYILVLYLIVFNGLYSPLLFSPIKYKFDDDKNRFVVSLWFLEEKMSYDSIKKVEYIPDVKPFSFEHHMHRSFTTGIKIYSDEILFGSVLVNPKNRDNFLEALEARATYSTFMGFKDKYRTKESFS